MLVPLTEHRLRYEVALAAHWQITKTRGGQTFTVAAEPPLSVIQNMLAQPALPLPILRRIAETPVFAPDGRLIEAAGYDAPSGVYLHPAAGLSIPPVPERPTTQEMASARALICDDLLGDFPFVTEADRAAAVALLILPFVREMIDGPTPMHGIESASPGSGKGLLMDACTRPAFGGHGGLLTEAGDDDEWRKRIGTKLREGAPIIRIDNLTRPLDSGALASALTTAVFTDRLLGRNESFTAPVRCVWAYAANNPLLSTEIARRTIRCRIDPKMDQPWQRTRFKHPKLHVWMEEQRGALVHAALTLTRAWIVAGMPLGAATLGSYEQWAGIMGGILMTADIPDFLGNLAVFYENADVEGAVLREFVALWWATHGERAKTVAELFPLTNDVDGIDLGKGNDRARKTTFGMLLARQRDRVFGDHRIMLVGISHKVKKWRLVSTATDLLIPPDPPGGGTRPNEVPPLFPLATQGEPGGAGYLGVPIHPGHAGEKEETISPGSGAAEVPPGTPGVCSRADLSLCAKEKTGGVPGAGGTPRADDGTPGSEPSPTSRPITGLVTPLLFPDRAAGESGANPDD